MKKLFFLLLTISVLALGTLGIAKAASNLSNTTFDFALVTKSLDFDDDDLPKNVNL